MRWEGAERLKVGGATVRRLRAIARRVGPRPRSRPRAALAPAKTAPARKGAKVSLRPTREEKEGTNALQSVLGPIGPDLHSSESVQPQLAHERELFPGACCSPTACKCLRFFLCSATSICFSSRSFLFIRRSWCSSNCQLVPRVVSSSSKRLSERVEGSASVLNVLGMAEKEATEPVESLSEPAGE